MIKARIILTLINGERITYVNEITQDTLGINSQYYGYENSETDTFEDQTGNGKIKGDLDSILDQLGNTGLLIFPENGNTASLGRKNNTQSLAQISKIRKYILIQHIVSVEVVEQQPNEFSDLEKKRGIIRL